MEKSQLKDELLKLTDRDFFELVYEVEQLKHEDYLKGKGIKREPKPSESEPKSQQQTLTVGTVFKLKTERGGIVYREIMEMDQNYLNCRKLKHDKESHTFSRTEETVTCDVRNIHKIVQNPIFV